MTAAILIFPAPLQQDLRAPIVAAARAVLRSEANHSDEILTEACEALRTWGDATDHMQADAVLLALVQQALEKADEGLEYMGLYAPAITEGDAP